MKTVRQRQRNTRCTRRLPATLMWRYAGAMMASVMSGSQDSVRGEERGLRERAPKPSRTQWSGLVSGCASKEGSASDQRSWISFQHGIGNHQRVRYTGLLGVENKAWSRNVHRYALQWKILVWYTHYGSFHTHKENVIYLLSQPGLFHKSSTLGRSN